MAKANKSRPKPGADKQPAPRRPAFKKAGSGIEAHGHVASIGDSYDGGSVRMTVKHGKPKRGGDGILSTYPDESSFTLDADAAKQFTHGQRIRIRVHPHGAESGSGGTTGKSKGKSSGAKKGGY